MVTLLWHFLGRFIVLVATKQTQLLQLKFGAQLCKDNGLDNYNMEMDSLVVANMLINGDTTNMKLKTLMPDIIQFNYGTSVNRRIKEAKGLIQLDKWQFPSIRRRYEKCNFFMMGMQQRNGTRGDVVLIGKSGHPLVINATIELALDPTNAKVVADGVKHDARGVETVECLVDNMSQQVDNVNKKLKKKSPSIEIGSPILNTLQPVIDSQTMNLDAREMFQRRSFEQQGATSTLRWAYIADEEEEQLVTPQQGLSSSTTVVAILSDHLVSSNIEKLASLTLINTNKQLQVGGSSTLSPNNFFNLDDEDISEEGEEEEMLDYCFANAARNADNFF
ncbi:hypothetical protein H5410_044548 [Solanum commersonii]|uniref:RNase H type-1 domain-containing protein n=1 Tax=Solanum commersonii TaxID=4109 RepID=A0A9J5X8E4_SOLCO|nr:hypothetical protein H5410_044548 [Solanum commersonii]